MTVNEKTLLLNTYFADEIAEYVHTRDHWMLAFRLSSYSFTFSEIAILLEDITGTRYMTLNAVVLAGRMFHIISRFLLQED